MNARIAPAIRRVAGGARNGAGGPADQQRHPHVRGEQVADKRRNDEKTEHQQHAGGGDGRGHHHAERQVEDKIPTQELAHVVAGFLAACRGQQRPAYEPMQRADDPVEHDELQQVVSRHR